MAKESPKYLSGPAHAALDADARYFIEMVVDEGIPTSVALREIGQTPRYLKRPEIQEALAERRAKHEKLFDVTRKQVVDGILEAAEMAKVMSEPMVMVAAWREAGRLCGYYEPQKTKIDITVTGNLTVRQIQEMPEEELLKLVAPVEALEGDYERVEPESAETES